MDNIIWYDYETHSLSKNLALISQFAGIQTDMDFQTQEQIELFCQCPDFFLIDPRATLITEISPNFLQKKGQDEQTVVKKIFDFFHQTSNTIIMGYNNFNFDDQITRFLFYRNLYPPYLHEYNQGHKRLDFINLVRLLYLFRYDDFKWLETEQGVSLKLEDFARLNMEKIDNPHNALFDIQNMIELAHLIKNNQPKLWQYFLNTTQTKSNLAKIRTIKPYLWVDSKNTKANNYLSVILPLCPVANRSNSFFALDLSQNLKLLEQTHHLKLAQIFKKKQIDYQQLNEEELLILKAIKVIKINESPILLPIAMLNSELVEKCNIDLNWQEKLKKIERSKIVKLVDNAHLLAQEQITNTFSKKSSIASFNLYQNPFIKDKDYAQIQNLKRDFENGNFDQEYSFNTPDLNELVSEYKARYYYYSLDTQEKEQWKQKLQEWNFDTQNDFSYEQYKQVLEQLENSELTQAQKKLIQEVKLFNQKIIDL